MSEKILGAQLFTVRDFIKNDPDFENTMRRIAAIGYKSVQLSCCPDVTPACIKRMSEETGMHIDFTHISFDKITKEPEQAIADHAVYGCKEIGLGYGPVPFTTEESVKDFCETLKAPIEIFKKNGVKFLYHNHRKEFQRIGDKWGIEIMLENLDPDTFGLIFDVYWAAVAGVDPALFIRKHGSRIRALHLKDMAVIDDASIMCEVLEGNINFDAIIEAAEEANIKYYEVELDDSRIDPFDSLKISHDNLKARYDFR